MSSLWIDVLLFVVPSLPLLIFIFVYKKIKPKYYGMLFGGLFLIAYAAMVFHSLSEFKVSIENLYARYLNLSASDKELYRSVHEKLELWLYALPVAVIAVGANLITDFLKANEPSNRMGSK